MRVLGIESSCDETAASVVLDGTKILSNVVNSQMDIHAKYGGVVPEVAARSHIEVINPVINQALKDSGSSWDDIDAIGIAYAPGLSGSLLIGTLAARTLAILKQKPLYPIHHVKAHVYANFLTDTPPSFPVLALIVSGKHSELVLFESHQKFTLLGQTQDDAVGEAFDKVAKIIGLPYPGGPSVAKAAQNGDPNRYKLPKAKLSGQYDFSFSGLKTATLRAAQKEVGKDFTFPSHQLAPLLSLQQRDDFAASFQKTAVDTLVDKTLQAYQQFTPASVVVAGGVAANQKLREELTRRIPIPVNAPPLALCTDNAAMIATLAFYQAQFEKPIDPHTLEIQPSLSMSAQTMTIAPAS